MDDHQPPANVKDLLVELKDASELMVDLAYAAVFFNEEKLAEEVERLDERMNGHLRRLRMMAMLAARSPEDAEGMAGVLWIAEAIQRVGDAAEDIARIVAARLGIPDALKPDLRHADEITARIRVRDDAPMVGRDLRELSLPTETGMWVMAIRSGTSWEFDPGPDDIVSGGDVLLASGPEEGVDLHLPRVVRLADPGHPDHRAVRRLIHSARSPRDGPTRRAARESRPRAAWSR